MIYATFFGGTARAPRAPAPPPTVALRPRAFARERYHGPDLQSVQPERLRRAGALPPLLVGHRDRPRRSPQPGERRRQAGYATARPPRDRFGLGNRHRPGPAAPARRGRAGQRHLQRPM